MKELTAQERAKAEKELEKVQDATNALEGIPYEFENDAMSTLSDKGMQKEVAFCIKRGGVDGAAFLAAVKTAVTEWKALQKTMAKRGKELHKQEMALQKQLGD